MTRRFTILGAMLLALGACGSNGPSIAIEDVDDRYAEAYCWRAANCPLPGTVPPLVRAYAASSEPGCIAYVKGYDTGEPSTPEQAPNRVDIPTLVSSVDADRIEYRGEDAEDCFVTATSSCVDLRAIASCRRVWTGKVLLDGSCTLDEECEGTARCEPSTTGGCGRCVTRMPDLFIGRAAQGESCEPIDGGDGLIAQVSCAEGLYCRRLGDGTPATCTAPRVAGETCSNSADVCEPGTSCVVEGTGDAGTCRAVTVQVQQGLPCDGVTTLCNSFDRLVCTSGACELVGDASLGARCRVGYPQDCGEPLACDATSGAGMLGDAATGTCQERPGPMLCMP